MAAAGIGAAVAAGSRAAVSQTLDAGFDASGNIYLTFADGSPIGSSSAPGTLIPAGTYTIVLNNNGLDDYGNPHEYEIVGPGVNLSAGQAVQATWTATFQPGSTYVYEDVLNPTTERGVFGTPGSGAGTAPPAPPPSPTAPGSPGGGRSGGSSAPSSASPFGKKATPVFRGRLVGTVSAAGKLALTFKGKGVASLVSGRYTVTVTDRSTKSGFVLQEIHQPAITISPAGHVGTRTVTVDMSPGQWVFYPTFVGRKSYFIVIA